jgi:crotonobetainyl-CoA:carnitine CoA-transferase CaiB-like acyl-CoA transferase
MLGPYRVLDLTTERGLLCGQILADLGADVIQVEPPEGSAVRRLPPFYKDDPDPEHSLHWWAFTRNKRGLALDIRREEGRGVLRRLVESADFLIESEDPGRLDALEIGHGALSALNPRLIHVSITPFGQDGPKAGYVDTDLILMAAGGHMVLTGDEDRAPLRVTLPQAWAHASAEAAAAALIALHARRRSGRGQHVDVSVQQAVALTTLGAILGPALGSQEVKRIASGIRAGPLRLHTLFEARDGWVLVLPALTPAIGRFMTRLMEWLAEEGFCDAAQTEPDWGQFGIELLIGQRAQEELDSLLELVARFARSKTKRELLAGAMERKLLIAPVATIDDLVDGEQAAARGSVVAVGHPELDQEVRYPGPFARFERTPITYRRRPPRLGEHNREILVEETGYSDADLDALRAAGVTT